VLNGIVDRVDMQLRMHVIRSVGANGMGASKGGIAKGRMSACCCLLKVGSLKGGKSQAKYRIEECKGGYCQTCCVGGRKRGRWRAMGA